MLKELTIICNYTVYVMLLILYDKFESLIHTIL